MAIAAKKQGKTLTDELHVTFMGRNLDDVGIILKKEFGEDFDFDLFLKDTIAQNLDIMKQGVPLMKGVRKLLDYLHLKGIKTCIGTTTARKGTNALLEVENMLDEFDEIVCGDEVENGKPAPDIYLKCLSKFDVDKSEALIFEDGNAGGLAALAAGMRLVLVPDLAIIDNEVKNKAYKVIDDISKIIEIIEEENERTTSV